MLKCRSAFRTGVAGVYRGRGEREEGKVRQRDEGGEKASVSGWVVSLIISSFRSSSHSFLLMMHTGHSAPPLHSEKTDRDTGPLNTHKHTHTHTEKSVKINLMILSHMSYCPTQTIKIIRKLFSISRLVEHFG